MDIQCQSEKNTKTNAIAMQRGTSVKGSCVHTPGGVGRNICETVGALVSIWMSSSAGRNKNRLSVHMHSQIGEDDVGRKMVEQLQRELHVDVKDVKMDSSSRTSTVVALLDDQDGERELFACVADVADVEIPIGRVRSSSRIGEGQSRFVVCDANLSEESLRNVVSGKDEQNEYVFFEPTSVTKSVKIASIVNVVDATSPNAKELREMANALRRSLAPGSPPSPCPFNPHLKFASAQEALNVLAGDLQILHSHGVKVVFLTLGELGSIVSSSCGESGKTRYAHVKAERVNGTSTYSVVGAGDAFVAGVVFKLASSSKVKFNFKENVDAAAFGSKVAALCVETTKNSLGSTSENVRKLEKIVNSQDSSRIVELKPLIAAFP